MFEKMINTIENDQTGLVVCNITKEWYDKIQSVLQISKFTILEKIYWRN
jgi:hypothetical protein